MTPIEQILPFFRAHETHPHTLFRKKESEGEIVVPVFKNYDE